MNESSAQGQSRPAVQHDVGAQVAHLHELGDVLRVVGGGKDDLGGRRGRCRCRRPRLSRAGTDIDTDAVAPRLRHLVVREGYIGARPEADGAVVQLAAVAEEGAAVRGIQVDGQELALMILWLDSTIQIISSTLYFLISS